MRRLFVWRIVSLVLGLVAALAVVSPAYGAAAQPQTTTVAVTNVSTITFAQPADHVAVYWPGNPDARVTLAFSSDGTDFGRPVDAGRDDAGPEAHDGMTYGAVQAVDGVVAVRVTTDVPLAQLTAVAMPREGSVASRLVSAAELAPLEYEDAQPVVIPRAVWGADPAYLSWAPRFYPAKKVIVHHTSDNIVSDGTPEYYAKLVRAIYYYHAITQDWGDIAYNYLIDPLGNIYEGRYSDDDPSSPPGEGIYGNDVVGGHCANYNTGTVGIAVLGTYNDKSISSAARASLEELIAWVAERDGIDPIGFDPYYNPYDSGSTIQTWNIAGHLDYRPTDCPGAAFYKALPSIRQDVFALTGPATAPTPSPTYLILEKSDSSPVVGKQVTVTATLKEQSSRLPLPGRPVSFAVGGIASEATFLGTAITDANGVASLQMTCTTAQLQWVSAGFDPGTDPLVDPLTGPLEESLYRGSTTSSELYGAVAGLAALLGGSQVQLSWTPEAAATSYNVYRDDKKVNKTPVLSAAYLDAGLSNPSAHSYQVTAIVSGRESAKSPKVTASPYSPGEPPVDDPANAPLFPDVLLGYPYYTAIEDLAMTGIINGAPGGLFLPGDPVTRQQFSKMIVLGGDYLVSEDDVCPFKDVDAGGGGTLYPDNYVAVCAAHGITLGKTATTFVPYASITRAQVMTMVVRAAQDLKPSAIQEPPAGWKGLLPTKDPAHGANIARAECSGLLAGIDLSAFSVNGKATRGEIAQIIWNLRAK